MRIDVREGELIDVQVVGFHGFVADDATPQRKAPLFMCGGQLVRIGRGGGVPWEARAIEAESFDAEAYERSADGESTLFEKPISVARAGWVLTVLGEWEIRHLAQEPGGVHPTSRALEELVEAMRGPVPGGDACWRTLGEGETLRAWYAPIGEANGLFELVRRRAKARFFEGDDRVALESAWKLFAAAPGLQDEMALAVAMLHRHGFEDWRDMATAIPGGGRVSDVLSRGQDALAALDRTVTPARPHPAGVSMAPRADHRARLRKAGTQWGGSGARAA